MKELQEIRANTQMLARGAQCLLDKPQVQARTPLAKEVRKYLICGLHHADRVVACIREGEDYRYHFDLMNDNLDTAHRRVRDLRHYENLA